MHLIVWLYFICSNLWFGFGIGIELISVFVIMPCANGELRKSGFLIWIIEAVFFYDGFFNFLV